MAIGHWKYEINPATFLKGAILAAGIFGTLYLGESCHFKQRVDEFRRSDQIAATSANPNKLSVEGTVEYLAGERRVLAYLENRELGVRYPLDAEGHTRRPLEQLLAMPEIKTYVDAEIRRKIEERDRFPLVPSHAPNGREPPQGILERIKRMF